MQQESFCLVVSVVAGGHRCRIVLGHEFREPFVACLACFPLKPLPFTGCHVEGAGGKGDVPRLAPIANECFVRVAVGAAFAVVGVGHHHRLPEGVKQVKQRHGVAPAAGADDQEV